MNRSRDVPTLPTFVSLGQRVSQQDDFRSSGPIVLSDQDDFSSYPVESVSRINESGFSSIWVYFRIEETTVAMTGYKPSAPDKIMSWRDYYFIS